MGTNISGHPVYGTRQQCPTKQNKQKVRTPLVSSPTQYIYKSDREEVA